MAKIYNKVTIQTVPFNSELLSGIFLIDGCTGSEEIENGMVFYFEQFDESKINLIENILNEIKNNKLIDDFSINFELVEQKNWNEEWEKSLHPIRVSNKIIIKPSFRDYQPHSNEIVIEIDPKMSFGTGYHETTRLMIRLIEKHINDNSKVLDVGTGTGILAIAAIKLGAKFVEACDIDLDIEKNFLENISRNNVRNYCKFTPGSILDINSYDFDLILANIHTNVLIEIANEIKKRLKPNGKVILSGILINDINEIVKSYERLNLKLIDKETENEWAGLVFELKEF